MESSSRGCSTAAQVGRSRCFRARRAVSGPHAISDRRNSLLLPNQSHTPYSVRGQRRMGADSAQEAETAVPLRSGRGTVRTVGRRRSGCRH